MLLKNRRLSSYPLLVKDPFFSFWCASDDPTGSDVVFWHGEKKPLVGTLTVDGMEYRFLGRGKGHRLRLKETHITAFGTTYRFAAADFKFTVEFLSPLPPDDIELLSLPVTFVNYAFESKRPHDISVKLAMEERAAYDTCFRETRREEVRIHAFQRPDYLCVSMGLLRQLPLSHSFDEVGADWGYFYLAGETVGKFTEHSRRWICAANSHTQTSMTTGALFVAFDDVISIYYFGEYLKNYWQRDGKTVFDALDYAYSHLSEIKDICKGFDHRLAEMASSFSEDYLLILYASLRQSVAAHKAVRNAKGELLFLSKECNSDGCIATVDISYPSMPLYLLFNPSLVKGMMLPIITFAKMPVWQEHFAPHDAGIYPYCCGQYYAMKERSEEDLFDLGIHDWKKPEVLPFYYTMPYTSKELYDFHRQMPIEESGNMLIMTWLYYCVSADSAFLEGTYDLFADWVDFLVKYGLIPAEQLCTDDFAGHSDKNANLSVKAIVGIRCFSRIAEALKKGDVAQKYGAIAKDYAEKWHDIYAADGHTVLSQGMKDTFSMKYNIAIDVLLGEGLFDPQMIAREHTYYETVANRYGIPLDSRNTYTKTDWLMWVASMGGEKLTDLYAERIVNYLNETNQRVPFSDWIDSVEPKYYVFRNRTVQGGCFMPLLKKYWHTLVR